MLLKTFITTALIAITPIVVKAHMTLATPTPFGVSDLNNSPLEKDGSDFPCKQRGANTYNANGVSNQWPIGSTQTLSFKGSAVHGGGSCQVSLTTDKAPTKSSKFFVIHSIVGGCPSNATNNGNLPADPNGNGANKYTFTIPDGVSPGEYTMAWTWFNRIGNREMYMNCAPVTVSGGTKTKRAVEQRKAVARSLLKRANFPDMFVANIGNGCATSEGADVQFPSAGDSVEKDGADGKLAPPTGSCAAAGSSSGSSPAPPAPPTSSAAPAPNSSSAPPSPSSASSSAAPTSAPAPTTSSNPAPAPPAASPVASPAPANGSSAGAISGACETGAWNCFNNGLSFQRCGSGSWSVSMATAAGNPCKVGEGMSAPW